MKILKQKIKTEVVVLGGGPGGYTAAFRLADLGKQVVLIERGETLGGVCLNVGCIPSKTLLHIVRIIEENKEIAGHGVSFGEPEIDLGKLRAWQNSVVVEITAGLANLAKRRKVQVVHGVGEFASVDQIIVRNAEEQILIDFDQAIIAVGSEPAKLPFVPEDLRIMNSTGALNLEDIPKNLLIIGGGIISLEMAAVYSALGSKVSVVEIMDRLIPGADSDLVRPLHNFIVKKYERIMLGTKVTKVEVTEDGLLADFEGELAPDVARKFDRILVAVGRHPNGLNIGADNAGINVDDHGFICIDNKMRTNISNIYAIGDVVGNPMLAHKATADGRFVAEIIAGIDTSSPSNNIPFVAYTDPEIAWVGLTEIKAKEQNIKYGKGVFPWLASGRSLSMGRREGVTKLLFNEKTKKLLGAGIVGPSAGELISELTLAIEIGCTANDIVKTIHPHPTLSETIMMSAKAFEGTITDLYMPKK